MFVLPVIYISQERLLSDYRKYTASTAFFEALWDVCSSPDLPNPSVDG